MSDSNYWTRKIRTGRLSRRRFVGTAAAGGVGAAGLALVGCGDDDDDDPTAAPTSATGATATTSSADPTATTDASAGRVGGKFRWAWQGTPHLDMHQDSISGASSILPGVYNRLLRYQDEGQIPEPDLAVTMPEQPDETTLVFKLHEGVKFQNKAPINGRVMTAADAAFSLDRARTDDPLFVHAGDLASIDTIEALDDNTLKITTKFPNAVLLTTLAGYQFFVFAPEILDSFPDLKTDAATVGTGGYIIESASTDQGATLLRNPDYWRTGQPYFEELEQIVIGDHWSQFLAGHIEVAAISGENSVGFDSFEAVIEDAGMDAYTYTSVSAGSAQGHFMHNGAPPFDDVRVREAINLIMNRDDNLTYGWPLARNYSISLGQGHLDAGFGFSQEEMSKIRGYRKDLRDQDVADGLALLAQAGFDKDNPLEFEIMGWSVPHRMIGIDELQLAAEMYARESGGAINASVNGLEWGTWKQAEARHEFQMISSAYSMGVDAHEAMQKMYHSEGGRNFAAYADPAFDAMLQDEQGTFDIAERQQKVKDMLTFLNEPDRIPNAWTGTGPGVTASLSTVKNRPPLFDQGKIDQLYYG